MVQCCDVHLCLSAQGFEDCLLLDDLLTKHEMDLERVLPEYTELRNPDAEAICDLAMYNYVEVGGGRVQLCGGRQGPCTTMWR